MGDSHYLFIHWSWSNSSGVGVAGRLGPMTTAERAKPCACARCRARPRGSRKFPEPEAACGLASLAAAWGVQLKAFGLAYPGQLSLLRTRAELGGTPEEASGTGVEAVQESEAFAEREAAATRQEVALDLFEAVEVVESLEALQLEMEPVNNQARTAFACLRQNLVQRRRTLLGHRRSIIQGIPGFWAKAIVNHPEMLAMISDEDEDLLSYMIDLEVEEIRHPIHCCKIMMFFRDNPYFRNKVIIKEYLINVTGYRASHSTPVQWYQDYEHEAYSCRHHNSSVNFFFNWFSDHNFAGSNRIAEIICEDLWLNPLRYHMRMQVPGQGTERA
ncbi:testis-specific Y-encoded protein 3-like, partial [Cynocephalus volans]|uniref:testis-specific Y-encoded protein 3-like n=1 Tax=Cynocephalus volans TaxID=110931 RepID=UPI002FCA37E5